jgi:hypothetical protein
VDACYIVPLIMQRYIAVLIGLALGAGAAWGEERQSYPPEDRVKKLSFDFTVDRTEYADDYFNRQIFLGGDFTRTRIQGEYQYNFSAQYQFTNRFSVGARAGYTETQIVDPAVYTDPRILSIFNPYAARIIQCSGTEGGKLCDADVPVYADVLDLRATSLTDLKLDQKSVPGKLGDLTQMPLVLSARLDLMTKTRWRPYIAGTIGYTMHTFTDDNTAARLLEDAIANAMNIQGHPGQSLSGGFTGTQGLCQYLADQGVALSDEQLMCANFNMPDGSTVPGLIFGGKAFFMQGLSAVDSISWNTEVPNSMMWGLESGFTWNMSKRWDVVGKLSYTWYEKKVRSTINGSDQPLLLALPDTFCDDPDIDPITGLPVTEDCIQDFIMVGGSSVSAGVLNTQLFDFIRAEPASFRLDVWHFGVGLRYTFGR